MWKRIVYFLHAIWLQQKQNQDKPTAVWSSQILCWTWLQPLKFGEREREGGRREARHFWWPTFFSFLQRPIIINPLDREKGAHRWRMKSPTNGDELRGQILLFSWIVKINNGIWIILNYKTMSYCIEQSKMKRRHHITRLAEALSFDKSKSSIFLLAVD